MALDAARVLEGRPRGGAFSLWKQLEVVNKELWILLSVFVIAAILNFAVTSQRMVLALYTLPTVLSAYCYGRRHATLTSLGSALVVTLILYANPGLLQASAISSSLAVWIDVGLWASVLLVTAYAMGTLYEHKTAQCEELRHTYFGVLEVLRHFISNDKYTENHSYRVSMYALRIGARLDLAPRALEDVRAAALLHDIGKLHIGRELLYKASRLTQEEYGRIEEHVPLGVEMLETVGGSLRRVLPIVLNHHERYDGGGKNQLAGDRIPPEARLIKVADVYDALTSDRPYRKAMPPFEARNYIVNGSGTEFDPVVVRAFEQAFEAGELELPQFVV
ncbi:MAG TPA: HD domain-containing phosphohydrolase [Vicinamibacterales bacterium]|nr:HD domain-containing phosphohydrolase [Vicinamibacterales bacterium]